MAFPQQQGLLPSEAAFLCEMELVTIVPRQRLERLDLLGGPTNPLVPPQRTNIPLWLALLLKRQRRANIVPPPWLTPESLRDILDSEVSLYQESFSPAPKMMASATRQSDYDGRSFYTAPPFVTSNTSTAQPDALPYHWFEMSEMLLDAASDDLQEADVIRGLLKDIREVRLAKMRKGVEVLGGEGEGIRLDGVGAMEISESRGLILGVIDGLRKIGASRETARREREEEERLNGGGRRGTGTGDNEDEDEDML